MVVSPLCGQLDPRLASQAVCMVLSPTTRHELTVDAPQIRSASITEEMRMSPAPSTPCESTGGDSLRGVAMTVEHDEEVSNGGEALGGEEQLFPGLWRAEAA